MNEVRIDAEAGVIYSKQGNPLRCNHARYLSVRRNGKCWMAHRLIWEYVHGPIPAGMQINHVNGIKSDNRIANLELVTRAENMAHAWATGLLKSPHHERVPLPMFERGKVVFAKVPMEAT